MLYRSVTGKFLICLTSVLHNIHWSPFIAIWDYNIYKYGLVCGYVYNDWFNKL